MISIIWFLVGFICGIFSVFLVVISYEEHRTLKFEKYTPITDEQDRELTECIKKEKEQKVKSIKFPKRR